MTIIDYIKLKQLQAHNTAIVKKLNTFINGNDKPVKLHLKNCPIVDYKCNPETGRQ